jgi:DNA topoisomerase I
METQFKLGRLKWQTLQHNGIAFPPEYKPRNISISIVGEEYSLNTNQEELIMSGTTCSNQIS